MSSISIQDVLNEMDLFFETWDKIKKDNTKPLTLQTLVAVFLLGTEKLHS